MDAHGSYTASISATYPIGPESTQGYQVTLHIAKHSVEELVTDITELLAWMRGQGFVQTVQLTDLQHGGIPRLYPLPTTL